MSCAIYVGRDLTVDGHALLAGYGDEPSGHWLEIAPRRQHPPGAVIEVGVTAAAATPGVRSSIPQAAETARHLRVGYSHYLGVPGPLTNGGLNEHGVPVSHGSRTSFGRGRQRGRGSGSPTSCGRCGPNA